MPQDSVKEDANSMAELTGWWWLLLLLLQRGAALEATEEKWKNCH